MGLEEMLIYFIVFAFAMLPFGFIGVKTAFGKLKESMAMRGGKLKMFLVTPNFRLKEVYGKPKGKNIENKGKSYDFEDKPGKILFKGRTPVTFYNEKTRTQLNMAEPNVRQEIDPQHYNDLLIRMYNLGKLAAQNKNSLLVILVFAGLACSAGALIFEFQNSGHIGEIQKSLDSTNAQNKILTDYITQIQVNNAGAAGQVTLPAGH